MEAGSSTPLPERRLVTLKFAEVHTPLFFAGKNHGQKLDPSKLASMQLVYDRDEKELIIGWKDARGHHECIVPLSNVASMTPGDPRERIVTPIKTSETRAPARNTAQVETPAGRITAQVETPQSHVFGGAGQGRTK